MQRRIGIGLIAFALLGFGGSFACGGGDETSHADAEDIDQQESALADCSDDLGKCYTECQGEQPTPRPECFPGCDCKFYRCIDLPMPACGPESAQ